MKKIMFIICFIILLGALMSLSGCTGKTITFEPFEKGLSLREYYEKNKECLGNTGEWKDETFISETEEGFNKYIKTKTAKEVSVEIKDILYFGRNDCLIEFEKESEDLIDDIIEPNYIRGRVPDTNFVYESRADEIGEHSGYSIVKYRVTHGVISDGQAEFTKDGETLLGFEGFPHTMVYYSIPSHVKRIGAQAFDFCPNLKEVYMSDSVTEIDDLAFSGNGTDFPLEKIRFSKNLKRIGKKALSSCYNLKSLELPEGLEIIDRSGLPSPRQPYLLVLPNSIKEVGRSAIQFSIIDKIPPNLTTINYSAFSNCTINNSDLPIGLKSIESEGLNGCTFKDTKNLIIPETVTKIESHAFCQVEGIDTVTLPQNITTIKWGMFSMSSIKSMEFSANVSSIERFAFFNCLNLSAIVLPTTITYCYPEAFMDCKALALVTVETDAAASEEHFTLYEHAETVYFIDNIAAPIKETEEFLARFKLAEEQDREGYYKFKRL